MIRAVFTGVVEGVSEAQGVASLGESKLFHAGNANI